MNAPVLTAVAWPYANGPRHIGHVSGFGVPSDIFARYQRMAGNRVLMISGTDEHGTPIQVQADQEGVTPRQLVDKYNRVIVGDLQGLGLSYDLFTYPVITGDYAGEQARWLNVPIEVGRPLAKPTPLFRKLDPTLAETGPHWAPILS